MDKPKPIYPFLTIDPGTNIGLALFYEEFEEPCTTKVIQAKQGGDWDLRSQVVLHQFEYEIKKMFNGFNEATTINRKRDCRTAYVEKPQFMEQGGRGLIAARDDSLFKLCCMYGAIIYILRQKGFTVIPIPTNWKGQMDKIKLAARLEKRTGKKYPDHIADAVGIGLFLKGIF